MGKGIRWDLLLQAPLWVCADIDGSAAGKTAEELRLSGGRAEGIRLDVTKPAEVQECFRSAAERLGSLDILVNNAGVEEINDFLSVTEEQYDKIMAVNLRGVFFCAQAAARIMAEQGRGKIVNMGLSAAPSALRNPPCTAVQRAECQITKTMAIERHGRNPGENAMGPGVFFFRTPMTEPSSYPEHRKWNRERIPAGRWALAEDLLDARVSLQFGLGLSRRADYLFDGAGSRVELPEGAGK